MNLTKDIINDLIPLYAANECSADTRALVEEYLRQNPRDAEQLRRVLSTPVRAGNPRPGDLDEMQALRKARRHVRLRSWLMAFAIFFSIVPFSVFSTGGHTYWLLIESPKSALIYASLGALAWIAYAMSRHRAPGI